MLPEPAANPDEKVKVLYIVGCGFSGSTILHNILGQIEGFFAVGELRILGQGSLTQNRPCGCGKKFRECEFWNGVFQYALGGMDQVDVQKMARGSHLVRSRFLPLLFAPGGERILTFKLRTVISNLDKVYRGIQQVSGCRVIVDESKTPVYARIVSLLPSAELYLVHLIRDPRGVTNSAIKRSKWGAYRTSLYWSTVNPTAESLRRLAPERYLRLRYEDFACQPKATVQRIVEMVGEPNVELPFIGENKVELHATHTVGGNANRFHYGTLEIAPDETWRKKLSRTDQRVVSLLTAPLLKRYGYI